MHRAHVAAMQGAGGSDDEEEKLRQWKAMLEREDEEGSSDEDDVDLGPPPSSSQGLRPPRTTNAGADALVGGGYSSNAAGAPTSAAGPGSAGFSWDGFSGVREMQETNVALLDKMHSQEREISVLKQQLASLEPVLQAASTGSNAKEAKVIELAKKVRTLTVQVNKEKAKAESHMKEVQSLKVANSKLTKTQQTYAKMANKKALGSGDNAPSPREEDSNKAKELAEQVKFLQAKFNEQKAHNERLKVELNKAQKAVQREIGDDADLSKLLDENSNWRGRAQQITLLKAKIRDLKSKLASGDGAAAGPVGEGTIPTGGSPGAGGRSGQHSMLRGEEREAALFEQHKAKLESIERDRRRELEDRIAELEARHGESDKTKLKLEGLVSRVKILEGDNRSLREKLSVLLTKTEDDDKLIDAMRRQLESKASHKVVNKPKSRPSTHSAADVQNLQAQLSDAQSKSDRQERIILALQQEIQSEKHKKAALEHELREARDAVKTSARVHSLEEQGQNQQMRMLNVEVERLRELLDVMRSRNEESEDQLEAAQQSLRAERQRAVALERRAESRGGRRSTPSEDKVQALVDQLNSSTDEKEAMQQSFQRMLEVKDAELVGLRRECEEKGQILQNFMAQMGVKPRR